MPRYEFSKKVRREADERSGGRCEALGEIYGLEPGQRCNAPFKAGAKEFDHFPVPATEKGSDTLDNCVVCCPTCHAHKTRTFDIPVQAKVKRVSDKHRGIRPASKWGSGTRQKAEPQRSATRRIEKWSLLS
ncbi:HNH endonuclease [Devosia naphthalenivorans]|uniref:HNH endonuclease n=1 Tax=Devosia naphthalenivorans TaxID=2082392 RepID=UPI000D3D833E|nr:HNH endonuclease signature motif containing protein [Devosia naphthalenivorans]